MRKIALFLFITSFFFFSSLYGQDSLITELQNRLKQETLTDSQRMETHLDLSWELRYKDRDAAIAHLEDYLRIGQKINHPIAKGLYLERMGAYNRIIGEVETARDYYYEALEEDFYHDPKNKAEYYSLIMRLAVVEGQLYNHDAAERYYKECVAFFEKNGNDTKLIGAYGNYGAYLSSIGKKDLSVEYTVKAFRMAEKTNDTYAMKMLSTNICNAYLQFNCDKSEEFCRMAMKLSKDDQSPIFSTAANALAGCYIKADRYKEAEQLLDQALAATDEEVSQSYSYYFLGQIYNSQKDYNRAETMYRKALTYKSTERHKAELFTVLSRVLLIKNQPREAYRYADKSVSLYKKTNILDGDFYRKALKALLEAASFNKINVPYTYVEEYVNLVEDLAKTEKKTRLNELVEQYQSEKKTLENEKLQQKIALQTAQNETQRSYLIGAGIGALLLSALAGLFLYQRRRARRLNADLSREKQQVEILYRELGHRAVANLNLATNLLQEQKATLSTTKDKALLDEIEHKIFTISAVQRHLNKQQNNASDYSDLLREVTDSLTGGMNKPVETELNIAPAELNPEQKTYLLLIVNELITNSLKYAFDRTPQPRIAIDTQIKGGTLHLKYRDNGSGKSEKIQGSGIGTGLLQSMIEQLDGDYTEHNDNGYTFNLQIPTKNVREHSLSHSRRR